MPKTANSAEKPATPAKRRPARPAMCGPFYADAPVTLHPKFKLTRAPAPPVSLHSNTYPVF